MAAKLDYRWNLRRVMAERGMFATTDLSAPLAKRGIELSSSQVYRLAEFHLVRDEHVALVDTKLDRPQARAWTRARQTQAGLHLEERAVR